MKAAVFYGDKTIRVEEHELRELRPDEIMIDVKAAGICGTDIHIYNGSGGATDCNPPVVLGHELAGVVSEVGSSVKRIKVGDRVCVDPNVMCGGCDFCHDGEVQFCENMYATGVNCDGGFAEKCIVLERQAFVVDPSISFEAASMCEPLACALHGFDLSEVKPGHSVLIIGGGTIGLTMLQLCKLAGATKIAVSEPDTSKHALAKELGADHTIDPLHEKVREKLNEYGMKHINVVIECVGRINTMQDAIEYCGRGGLVMLFGLTDDKAVMEIKPFELFRKELTIRTSFVNPQTQRRSVELLNSRRLQMDKLVAEVIPLEKLEEKLAHPGSAGKIIVRP